MSKEEAVAKALMLERVSSSKMGAIVCLSCRASSLLPGEFPSPFQEVVEITCHNCATVFLVCKGACGGP